MSSTQIVETLLSKGFFPKELPPAFTTEDFGTHSADILVEWETKKVFKKDTKSLGKIDGKKRNNAYTYKLKPAELEIISKPKHGYERRNVHITHPIPQALLCNELAINWKEVQKWLSRQTFSEDRIQVSAKQERAIEGINFPIHTAKKNHIEATSNWLVKTDITRFYPSIYTHSIPWAAYGKEQVKGSLGKYKGSLADRLDLLVRSCNRNQTIGIPIGPETSRIIAEIISSRIDNDYLAHSAKTNPRYAKFVDRLQDDWFVGVDTLEDAEKIISTISSIYREFGLDINGSKTSIEHIISSSKQSWISEVNAYLSHRSGFLEGSRLEGFLSLCLHLQSENPRSPIINYALAIIEGRKTRTADVEILESFLLKVAVIAPISMDRVCRVLLNLEFKTKAISRKRISSRFTALAEKNLENGNLYEVIWLLYTLRGLKAPFRSKKISELAETTPSSALALVLLDMKSKKLVVSKLPNESWENIFSKERVLTDWTWLLAYEGIRNGWLRDHKQIMKIPFFEVLSSKNVIFYDPKKNIPRSEKVVQKRQRIRSIQSKEAKLTLQQLRGVLEALNASGEY